MAMGQQQVRRLIRRTDGKMIGGVAGGLGDYFGVDPVWFRLGFVLAVFAGGAGILAYIVLWIIMPAQPGANQSVPERELERVAHALRGTPTWIGVGLVILGAILLLNAAVDWRPGVIWGIALIVLGALFFVQRTDDAETPVIERPAPPVPPEVPSSIGAVVSETRGAPPLPPTPPTGAALPPPPRPVRERSTLGFMTFGALLLTIGVVTLLDTQDVLTLTASQYLAMALGVIGVGLLVGSLFGRARWLIVPGIFLIPPMLAASLIHVPWEGGFGQRNYRPTGVPAIVQEYHLIAGDMTIDLTDLDLVGNFKVEATTVAGHILVIVPEGTSLDIEAKAGGGQISLFGQTNEGVNVSVHRTFNLSTVEGTGEPLPATIELDLEAGLGQVEVRS